MKLVRQVPDFPEPGISFKDITTLLADGPALAEVVGLMAQPFGNSSIKKVLGIEARGFILGTPIALELNCGFVPVRKEGKLPAETLKESYELEYGTNTVEIHRDAVEEGDRGADCRRCSRDGRYDAGHLQTDKDVGWRNSRAQLSG